MRTAKFLITGLALTLGVMTIQAQVTPEAINAAASATSYPSPR